MKKIGRFSFLLVVLVMNFSISFAQKKDSVKVKFQASDVGYLTMTQLNDDSLVYSGLDTSLENFSNYLPREKEDEIKLDLGNPGSAARLLIPLPKLNPGYGLGMNRFEDYMTNPEDLRLYNTGPRFTNISYGSGVGKAQFFEVSHGQNITPLVSFGLDYNKINATGLYSREENDHTTVDFYLWYRSPKERYQAVAGFIFNRIVAQENGGIENDSLFLNPRILQTEFEPFKLGNAENNVINKQVFLNQSYTFGRIDTLDDKTLRLKKGLSLNHDLAISESRHYYQDASGLSFYDNVYFDSTSTYNYLAEKVINQKAYISLIKPFGLSLVGRIGLIQKDVDLTIYKDDSLISETKMFGDFNLQISEKFNIYGEIERVVLGRQYADQSIVIGGEIQLGERFGVLRGEGYLGQAQPYFMLQYYQGNNFIWRNSFEKQEQTRLTLNYELDRMKLDLGLISGKVQNHVFIDFSGTPRQVNSGLNYTKITIEKDFQFGDFNMENYYAGMITNPALLRIPDHFFRHSFYFTKPLFKKALNFQTGIELVYYSKFAGIGYSPSTTLFYNVDGFETGGYPITSFFIHAQVKRVRFFGKVTNLTQGVLGEGVYNFYGYPIQDRGISLGLSWDFLD
ncbi:MAG: hypothetical protein ACJATA_000051 [Sphingobacteriales bacterium]